jgi:homopolymeric O-antigen transport system permease protein
MSEHMLAAQLTKSDLAEEQKASNSRQAKDDFDIWLEAGRTEKHYWLDLWRYRELFVTLAWRDIAVRYKQTVAGVSWSLLQPLLTMLIMTFVFGRLAGLHSEGDAPYAIMVFSAMLPWQFFANALFTSGQSLVNNASLVSKIYFPRLIIPASMTMVSLADFLISFLLLAVMMVCYHFVPSWRILTLPLFMLLAFVTSLGPGLFVTALNVRYRDFRFVLPFIIQFGLYLCPVGYSSTIVREKFGDIVFLLYSLNPMVGVIDGFRWAILGQSSNLSLPGFGISVLLSIALLILGVRYFRKMERSFADII